MTPAIKDKNDCACHCHFEGRHPRYMNVEHDECGQLDCEHCTPMTTPTIKGKGEMWEDIARKLAEDAIKQIINMPETAMIIEDKIYTALKHAREEALDEAAEVEMEQRVKRYNQAKEDGTLDKHFPKL